MNGVHDMGGMHGFGKVEPRRTRPRSMPMGSAGAGDARAMR